MVLVSTLVWLLSLLPVAPPVSSVVVSRAEFVPGGGDWGPVRVQEGGRLLLVNAEYPGEQDTHDLVHDAEVPLFSSAEIGSGEWTEVDGVSDLPPGAYPFHCFIHRTLMTGILEVLAPSP
jgi:hypothetical protein